MLIRFINWLLGGHKVVKKIQNDPEMKKKMKSLQEDIRELKELGDKYFQGYENWDTNNIENEAILQDEAINEATQKTKEGFRFFRGEGTEEDFSKAVKCFTIAQDIASNAPAGFFINEAEFGLGLCYYFGGYGVEQSYKRAIKHFKKAAERGFVDAQYFLGICYYNGTGLDQNNQLAINWLKQAAKQGHSDAKKMLITLTEPTK